MNDGSDYFESILPKLKIDRLNTMQLRMWEAVHKDQDVLLLSPTGSGKTLAFLLPTSAKIDKSKPTIQALVIAPTRELAIQIYSVMQSMGTGISTVLCYGGHSLKSEQRSLESKPQMVIGTPGRIHDHIRRENLDIEALEVLVLDEFDKSLELGFQDDIKGIARFPHAVEQFLFTSATDGIQIPDFLGLKHPKRLDFIKENKSSSRLNLYKVISPDKDKITTLVHLLTDLGDTSTLVFLNYREAVERVHNLLMENQIETEYFHGGLDQKERELRLMKFRNGSVRILVTTDLASRGLDIPLVRNVIHYQLPSKEDQFVHRNGRTARMHAFGNAFVLTSEFETLKDYLPAQMKTYGVRAGDTTDLPTAWVTIEFSKGKKDKINKIDVLGFLTKSCNLNGDQVGLIEIKPYRSYAAIRSESWDTILKHSKNLKIKGKSVKLKQI